MPASWIIFYKDGSTFSSANGTPQAAPRDYVQVVMQATDAGRDLMDHYDYYGWHNDRWIPHDADAIAQYQADPAITEKIVLQGYWIADAEFWAIHNKALDYRTWKSLPVRIVRDVARVYREQA
jgi:hypothetical protein